MDVFLREKKIRVENVFFYSVSMVPEWHEIKQGFKALCNVSVLFRLAKNYTNKKLLFFPVYYKEPDIFGLNMSLKVGTVSQLATQKTTQLLNTSTVGKCCKCSEFPPGPIPMTTAFTAQLYVGFGCCEFCSVVKRG
jgi:hypothetical protein